MPSSDNVLRATGHPPLLPFSAETTPVSVSSPPEKSKAVHQEAGGGWDGGNGGMVRKSMGSITEMPS